MKNNKFPNVTKELLDELERRYPDRMPDINASQDAIKISQGQISVIRFIRSQFDIQNKTILEN